MQNKHGQRRPNHPSTTVMYSTIPIFTDHCHQPVFTRIDDMNHGLMIPAHLSIDELSGDDIFQLLSSSPSSPGWLLGSGPV